MIQSPLIRRRVYLAVFALSVLSVASVLAQDVAVIDILKNPARNWNKTVTLVGQVQTVTANPIGTTRGTYTLLDDSSVDPITVRTDTLPPVGQTYSVIGTVIPDPASGAPILRELSRSAPGMSATMTTILVGAAVLFLALLGVFVALLRKPKPVAGAADAAKAKPAETIRAVAPARAAEPAVAGVAAGAVAGAVLAPAKTMLFMPLGADLVVERGPDKGKEHLLYQPITTMGRPGGRKNDIEIHDDTVSTGQASIVYDEASKVFSLTNESSTNPTRVNGQQVSSPTVLEPEALIEVGRTALRFRKS
jgi:hypothetical protein